MNSSRKLGPGIRVLLCTLLFYYTHSIFCSNTKYNNRNVSEPHPLLLRIHLSLVWTQYKVGLTCKVQEKRQVSTPSHWAQKWWSSVTKLLPVLISYSLQERRYPHLLLDDEEAATIIPPATRPTTPKAPVMIAMPIIPSAFNHQISR